MSVQGGSWARRGESPTEWGQPSPPTQPESARPYPEVGEATARPDALEALVANGGRIIPARPHPEAGEAAARPDALEALVANGGRIIPAVHERGVTVRLLRLLRDHIRLKCATERWTARRLVDGEWVDVALTPSTINLYEINEQLLKPMTRGVLAPGGCSFVELLSQPARVCKVFVSHAWAHPFESTVAMIEQHMQDRGYDESTALWFCAFSLRQNEPGAEIPDDMAASPFFLAIRAAEMTLVLIGEAAELLGRRWCWLEVHLSLVEQAMQGRHYLTDIYTRADGEVRTLTDGTIGTDWGSTVCKNMRDRKFPLPLLRVALHCTLSGAVATSERDGVNISTYIAASPGGEVAVNATLQARCFVALLPHLAADDPDLARGLHALRLSSLPKLSVSCGLEAPTMRALCRSLPRALAELHLVDSCLAEADAQELARFIGAESSALSALMLWNIGGDGGAEVCSALVCGAMSTNASMTDLYLGGHTLGEEAVGLLAAALRSHPALSSLSLPSTRLGDAGCAALCDAFAQPGCCPIVSVMWSSNALTDALGPALAAMLGTNRTLRSLMLDDNQLGDETASLLAPIASAGRDGSPRRFKSLTLTRNAISPNARDELVASWGAVQADDGDACSVSVD